MWVGFLDDEEFTSSKPFGFPQVIHTFHVEQFGVES